MQLIPTCDRSGSILGSIATLKDTLIQQAVIVTIICLVFLFHERSALVVMIARAASVCPRRIFAMMRPWHAGALEDFA